MNAPSHDFYLKSRPFLKDSVKLRAMRHTGRGIRTLFEDVLAWVAGHRLQHATLGELNSLWRSQRAGWVA